MHDDLLVEVEDGREPLLGYCRFLLLFVNCIRNMFDRALKTHLHAIVHVTYLSASITDYLSKVNVVDDD